MGCGCARTRKAKERSEVRKVAEAEGGDGENGSSQTAKFGLGAFPLSGWQAGSTLSLAHAHGASEQEGFRSTSSMNIQRCVHPAARLSLAILRVRVPHPTKVG